MGGIRALLAPVVHFGVPNYLTTDNDDVTPIHDLYEGWYWLRYSLNYSARNRLRRREAVFFSDGLIVPEVPKPLVELDRDDFDNHRPVTARSFAAEGDLP